MRTLATFLLLLSLYSSAEAQAGATAVPFLMIGTSLSGNGMGEIRGSVNNGSALMATFNPGLLGVQSFTTPLNCEFFDRRSPWLPAFPVPDLWIRSSAVTLGGVLRSDDTATLPIAIGVGYSTTYLNLGDFIISNSANPLVINTFHGYERVDALSIGLAVHSWISAGIGLNIKRIESSLSPFGTAEEPSGGKATPMAYDIGTFFDIPLLPQAGRGPFTDYGLVPQASLSLAYVYGKIGDNVDYGNPRTTDPLPREITAGYSLNASLSAPVGSWSLPVIAGRFIREAQDVAVIRTTSSDWSYQWGLGNIGITDNLLQGKASVRSTLRKGGEVTILGLVTLRKGSNKMDSREFFSTEGEEYHLDMVLPLFSFLYPRLEQDQLIQYLSHHLSVRFIRSRYRSNEILNNTQFQGFTVGFH